MAKRLTYKSAGVSIAANDRLVGLIQRSLRSTHDHRVLSAPGGFAGLFRLQDNGRRYRDPLLVGCSDGVGSKVLIAMAAGRLGGLGQDLVAMNVNDLITCGAAPLFFLDYVAVHRNTPKQTAELIRSIASGCRIARCALLGGETAEMPDLYKRGEFDLAGFSVGVVERSRLIDGERIRPGDRLIGLASSGLHSNGYSLARKVLLEVAGLRLTRRMAGTKITLGAELLRPTRIYVGPILDLVSAAPRRIRGMSHITGGGLPGNVPRMLPTGCQAVINRSRWRIPRIFRLIAEYGVERDEMFRVFNMGIGMVIAVAARDVASTLQHFKTARIAAREIGHVIKGREGVSWE